jgi:hypothetical protein
MLRQLKMNRLKYPNYKVVLIVLFFMALIVAVFIYYNRRLKGIENNLKQTSSLSCRIKAAMTNQCRLFKDSPGILASPRRRSPPTSSPKERTLAAPFAMPFRTLSFGEGRVRHPALMRRTVAHFP